jgi:hypothetical protein
MLANWLQNALVRIVTMAEIRADTAASEPKSTASPRFGICPGDVLLRVTRNGHRGCTS